MKSSISKFIFSNRTFWIVITLSFLCYFPIFSFLGTLPIRIWDESRLAMNAIEMINSGNLIVTKFDKAPDVWNTKPPLVIWLQSLAIKFFGVSEFSVRLPSAIAAFLTCLLIGLLGFRITKGLMLPSITVMVLITSVGFINLHGSRTGDYDAILTLFTTAYSISIFTFLETNKTKYLYYFFLFLTAALLTKGIAALMMLVGIVFYIILINKLNFLLRLKQTYIGTLIVIITGCIYYTLREFMNPGYLEAVWYNEIAGRYLENVEGHEEPFKYYFKNLVNERYSYYVPLLILGIVSNQFLKNENLKRLSLFCSLLAVSFLLVISFSTSKLSHYDLPTYPLFAIITGIFIWSLINVFSKSIVINSLYDKNIIPWISVFAIFWVPYNDILDITFKPKENDHNKYFYSTSYMLKKLVKEPEGLKDIKIIYNDYRAHIDFYKYILESKNIAVNYLLIDEVKNNDVILIPDENVLSELPAGLSYEIIKSEKFARLVKIYSIEELVNYASKLKTQTIDLGCYSDCSPWTTKLATNETGSETSVIAISGFEAGYECEAFKSHIKTDKSYSGNNSIYISEVHNYSASFKCLSELIRKFDFIIAEGYLYSESRNPECYLVSSQLKNGKEIFSKSKKLNVLYPETPNWIPFKEIIHLDGKNETDVELLLFFYTVKKNTIYFDDIKFTFIKE